jgi:hypothetical protein
MGALGYSGLGKQRLLPRVHGILGRHEDWALSSVLAESHEGSFSGNRAHEGKNQGGGMGHRLGSLRMV